MKTLALSDMHANWYALEPILARESYDALIFLGDVVDLNQIQESASGSYELIQKPFLGGERRSQPFSCFIVLAAGAV